MMIHGAARTAVSSLLRCFLCSLVFSTLTVVVRAAHSEEVRKDIYHGLHHEQDTGTTSLPVGEMSINLSGDRPIFSVHDETDQDYIQASIEALESSSPRHRVEKSHLLARMDPTESKRMDDGSRDRLLMAMYSFSKYLEYTNEDILFNETLYLETESPHHRSILEELFHYSDNFDTARKLVARNAEICEDVIETGLLYYGVTRKELNAYIERAQENDIRPDIQSVIQALRLLIRDWSTTGDWERKDYMDCVLEMVDKALPVEKSRSLLQQVLGMNQKQKKKILIPGSGLGRLAHELAAMGSERFEVTTNEWSSYVNLVYRYLLHHKNASYKSQGKRTALYPYISTWSHLTTRSEAERPVYFPSAPVKPDSALLVEGDFTSVFDRESSEAGDDGNENGGKYDMIITLFFIDTARSLPNYLSTVRRLLKPDGKGIWLNFGPLLYDNSPSVQLSLDEVVRFSEEGLGFDFVDLSFPKQSSRREETGNDQAPTSVPGLQHCGIPSVWVTASQEGVDQKLKVLSTKASYNWNASSLYTAAYMAQVWMAKTAGEASFL